MFTWEKRADLKNDIFSDVMPAVWLAVYIVEEI